jgi:hypothetical protein
MDRDWEKGAIQTIEAEFTRSANTHLLRVLLPSAPHDR